MAHDTGNQGLATTEFEERDGDEWILRGALQVPWEDIVMRVASGFVR